MASPRQPRRLSQAEQMEISLLIRRVEFLEARAEALDTLRQRISTCTSQLAYFQLEVERLQKVCDSLQSADPIIILCIAYSLDDLLGRPVLRSSLREPFTSSRALTSSSEPYKAACLAFNGKAGGKIENVLPISTAGAARAAYRLPALAHAFWAAYKNPGHSRVRASHPPAFANRSVGLPA